MALLARTDPDRSAAHRGLSLFIVPKPRGDGHGFEFSQDGGGRMEGRPIDTIGYRGMHSYEIALENWWVPAENLIGESDGLGRGFYFQMEGFENGRLQTAARAVGVMQAAYEQALDYARNRAVFGSNIFEYQLTRVKLGRMAVLIQAGRQFAYAVATMMAKQQGATEASMVKAYVCKAAEWVTREAMQIHGGFGYAEEYAVSRLFVDARVLSIFEGADETLCLKVIARRLVPADRVTPRRSSALTQARQSHRRQQLADRSDALEVGGRRGRRTGRSGSDAARPRRAPPMSIVTESPTYTIRSGAMPGKHGRACSKMRGSGLATPTTWLSTMHSTGVQRSGADLADTAAAELHLDLPGRVRHDPIGTPAAASSASAAIDSGIGHRHR